MKWFVLYTKPKHEKIVLTQLQERNYTAFLPQCDSFRQWSDRIRKIQVPLFPNYLFLKNNIVDYSVTKVHGVIKYISFEGQIATISDEEITLIKKTLDYTPSESNESFVVPGEKVRVISGSLQGATGIFLKKHGSYKLYIRIESLSRYLSVSIPADYVARITD